MTDRARCTLHAGHPTGRGVGRRRLPASVAADPRPSLRDKVRRCPRCQRDLSTGAFRRNRSITVGRYPGRSGYCRECDSAANRRWREENPVARAAYNAARRVDHPPRTCPTCAQEFKPKRIDSTYCRDACRPSNDWRSRRPRIHKYHRQRILNRDEWRCYLCDGDIPRDLAWPHPKSGTVDHVIPASAGGPDTDDNLRASHWACNEAKGDQLPGVEVWVPTEAMA